MLRILRFCSSVLLFSLYILVGSLLSLLIYPLTGIYSEAITLPLVGLIGAWIVAPFKKWVAVLLVDSIGLLLAYSFALPITYPEDHQWAYMTTNGPFVVVVLWSTLISLMLLSYEWSKYNHNKNRHSDSLYSRVL
jgi:hypothetical protein